MNLQSPTNACRVSRSRSLAAVGSALLMAVGLLAVVVPRPIAGQFHDVEVPADSYLWWALSDEITPGELKRLHSERSYSLERYDAAVAAGLEEPLSEEQRRQLKFYIHKELTPELVPMWWTYLSFARGHLTRRGVPADVVPTKLRTYGITPDGVETIMREATSCAAAHAEFMSELGPKQIEAQLLLAPRLKEERAGTAPPGPPILEVVRNRDYDQVAAVTGRSVDEIRELVDALAAWGRPEGGPGVVASCLPRLKDQVSAKDWQSFQRYLREVLVVPQGRWLVSEE